MMSPRAGVSTGGVGFGNVNVEAIQIAGEKDDRPRLVGFAFEPSPLRECLTALEQRGITYGQLRPVIATGPDGSRNTLWTNVTLPQFSDSDSPADATMHVFLSEYSPTCVNVEQRRARLRSELMANGGGPLGIESVKEIVVGARDLDAARALWQKLLDAAPSSTSNVAGGRRACDTPSPGHGEPTAVAFLQDKGLLGANSGQEATIDPSRIHGLNIRLVAKE